MIKDLEDNAKWAEQQWSQAQLGDKRRNKRAVLLGQALAARPDASLPAQTRSWAELKAAYRLLNEPDVTHCELTRPHFEMTTSLAEAPNQGVILFIQDTSELDYTDHPSTQGLGLINSGQGRGFMFHSCLVVRPQEENPEVLGLAQQHVWTRPKINKGSETRSERNKRRTEYDVWAEVVEAIGEAPSDESGTVWVSVGDRGSDVFSYWTRARRLGWHCLSRVVQNRVIRTPEGEEAKLMQWSRQLERKAGKKITLRGRDGKPKREAELNVAWSEVWICAPKNRKLRKKEPIRGWVIRCWEESESEDAIEWVLLSTVEITEAEEALEQVRWYACRWMIEEYHKCLKTGCGIEKRQLESAQGLKALLGLLAIVAVRLLQLRTISRKEPNRRAREVIPEIMVSVVARKIEMKREMTVGEFWRGVARLGGFIGRKSDGDAGWQTLWRGWQRLQDLCWGAEFAKA